MGDESPIVRISYHSDIERREQKEMMKYKQIYELTKKDLQENPVWYFPMDESVEDEVSAIPAETAEDIGNDLQIIVRTTFTTASDKKFIGYIYWNQTGAVEHLQPVILTDNGAITFWNGIIPPDDEYLEEVRTELGIPTFPTVFESEKIFNLSRIMGELEGIGYINDKGEEVFVR